MNTGVVLRGREGERWREGEREGERDEGRERGGRAGADSYTL